MTNTNINTLIPTDLNGIKIINATGHKITILSPDSTPENYRVVQEIEPTELLLRRREETVYMGTINGIPRYHKVFKEVEGLPPQKEGVYYIVSALCLDPNRTDLLIPLTLRDAKDRSHILGCTAFGC